MRLAVGLIGCIPMLLVSVVPAQAETYRERETAAMMDTDHCGPAFITEHFSDNFLDWFDGVHQAGCKRHDACYRLQEKSQTWCDNQFKAELAAICASVSWYGAPLCSARSTLFVAAVKTTYGGNAYGNPPDGFIENVRSRRISDFIGADEFEVCVDIRNPSKITQEYDVELFAAQGQRIDREPDTFEFNVDSGELKTDVCLTTDNTLLWSIDNIGTEVFLFLRADTPNNFKFTDDMVDLDYRIIAVPQN